MPPTWAPSGPDEPGADAGPSLDDRPGLGGVSETRRRDAIAALVTDRPETPYTVGELTVALSEWFQDETDGMVPTDEELHSVLYDFDLPRLDAADRLVFDRESGRVYAPDFEEEFAGDAVDETAATGRSDRSHSGESTPPEGESVDVSKTRIQNLAVLLVGVAGVAVGASSVNPLDTSFALVPAAFVVLFFGYRALSGS